MRSQGSSAPSAPWARSVGRVLSALSAILIALAGLGVADAAASEPPPHDPRDPQETDPNVGLFRLPAHRGEGDALAGPEGFGFLSKDDKFGMMIHWVLQADGRGELGTLEPGEDRSSFLVAFAGLALTTRFYERIRSELLVSFSQGQLVLSQAWLDADVAPWLHLKVGQFPYAISLERATSSLFFPLVSADAASALLPSVDTGVEAWGRVGSLLEYSLGLVNGATAGSIAYVDVDSNKDLLARAVASPFADSGPALLRGLSFGVGASGGKHEGTATSPELPILATWGGVKYFAYRSSALATGYTYRVVPQASLHAGPVSAYGEYERTRDEVSGASVASSAWGVVGAAVLTGEPSVPLHYVIPAHNFDAPRGHLGAVELVLGGGAVDVRDDGQLAARVDPKAAMRGARSLEGGVNWYPNLGVRVMVDVEHTWFAPLATFAELPAETLVVGRFQVVL